MIQHQLHTVVAAPLLLLANPLPVVLWLSRRLRHRLGRLLTRGTRVRRSVRALTWMPISWLLGRPLAEAL